uniref:(northern house mosquito) hypothetical protein n=1 Tax=Culex pipiens TaxID=7175 RepID=A0A8D8F6W0_CULPI
MSFRWIGGMTSKGSVRFSTTRDLFRRSSTRWSAGAGFRKRSDGCEKCRNGRLNLTACSTAAGGRGRPVDPGHTAFSTSSRQLSMCRNSSPGCKISSKQVRWLTLPGSSETWSGGEFPRFPFFSG